MLNKQVAEEVKETSLLADPLQITKDRDWKSACTSTKVGGHSYGDAKCQS